MVVSQAIDRKVIGFRRDFRYRRDSPPAREVLLGKDLGKQKRWLACQILRVCGELVILAEDALQRRLANRWEGAKLRRRMGLLFRLIAHLLLTLARLAGPGGVRAVAAESLAVKHQLLIMKRSRRRAPNLTGWDRLTMGFCTLLVSPRRLGKIAAA